MPAAITLRTRKPVDRLRPADFDVYPLWEYDLEGEGLPGRDETWVRPLRTKTVPSSASALHVASDFLLGSGASFRGFVTVDVAGDRIDMSGGAVLLTAREYLVIPTLPPSVARRQKDTWALAGFDRITKRFKCSHADIEATLVRFRVLCAGEKRGRVGYYYR